MLQRLYERCFLKWVLYHFDLKGNKQERAELRNLLRLLTGIPVGRKILRSAILSSRKKITLSFSKLKEGTGILRCEDNAVELVRIATDIPEMTEHGKLLANINMVSVIAHELQHIVTGRITSLMQRNAANVSEYKLAHVLGESDAYFWEDVVVEQLHNKHNVKPNRVYAYHHPCDPSYKLRVANSSKDPNFVKYQGSELKRSEIMPDPDEFLQDALLGRKSHVIRSVQSNLKTEEPFVFPRHNYQIQNKLLFSKGVQYLLQDMESHLTVKDIMNLFEQSSIVQRKKQGKPNAER